VSTGSPAAIERLRPATGDRRERARPVDAEVSVRPKFWVLLLLAVAAIVIQSTLLHPLSVRGARISMVTILVTWVGLRCGVTTGGFLGLIAGLIEDALGGSGSNVLGTALAGYAAGLLNPRFFPDSLPVFVSAVAGATILRDAVAYLVMEIGLGERGMFHHYSHEVAWQVVLNVIVAAAILLTLRVSANIRK
jgi:rod shape-determining protein MreD